MKIKFKQVEIKHCELDIHLAQLLEHDSVRHAIKAYRNEMPWVMKTVEKSVLDPEDIEIGDFTESDTRWREAIVENGRVTDEWIKEFLNEVV